MPSSGGLILLLHDRLQPGRDDDLRWLTTRPIYFEYYDEEESVADFTQLIEPIKLTSYLLHYSDTPWV
jgi:hypothetical protein